VDDGDRKLVGIYNHAKEIHRQLKKKKLGTGVREQFKAELKKLKKQWKGDPVFLSTSTFASPSHQARLSEAEQRAINIALDQIAEAEAEVVSSGKELNRPRTLEVLQHHKRVTPDGGAWSYGNLRRFLEKHRSANAKSPDGETTVKTPHKPDRVATPKANGQQPAL
jgi:hypothetical protein